MAFRVEWADDASRDFELIFDHLAETHVRLGEDADAALERAGRRTLAIRNDGEAISAAPYRGTLHEDLLPGLRHLTIRRAVFWFVVEGDEVVVRILAVFLEGQDHLRRMLLRLLE